MRVLGRQGADRDADHPAVVEDWRASRRRAPERFTRSAHTSVCRSSASPARPAGSCRRQIVCSGTGASTRQPGAARAASSSQRAFSRSRRRRACSPETPWSRMRHQSFSARNRRPSGMPQSRKFLTCPSTTVWRKLGLRAHHAHEVHVVAHVVERAIERGAQPLVRVQHMESAPSMPSQSARHSGRIMAEPAIAASTCSQRPCVTRAPPPARSGRCAGGGGAGRGHDRAGQEPARAVADRRVQRVRAQRVLLVDGTLPTFARPKPASRAAFSTELWAWLDV